MATYCAKFIPQFSDLIKSLRDLAKKNAHFQWQEEQHRAFQKVKDLLTSDTVVAYFDKDKQTQLVTDASPWSLSVILSQRMCGQDDRNIAHRGHQGIVKKWFLVIDDEDKRMVGDCLACHANGPDQHPDPLQMSPLPHDPWHTELSHWMLVVQY